MLRLTIIGFGNQAQAWTQNLRDSGLAFRVALQRGSASFARAQTDGCETIEIGSDSFFETDAIALLIPDHAHKDFLDRYGSHLRPGTIVLYNHGYSLVTHGFEQLYPQLAHVLFAVKAIGTEIRKEYLAKGKLGAVFSLEHASGDPRVKPFIDSLARGLGINLGLFPTTFLNETKADLFSEQGLLCSLVPYAAGETFRLLVERGIEPELAYLECWHELKLIVSAMVNKGPEGFFDLISPNALVGSEKGFKKLFTPELKKNLSGLLDEIDDGTFDRELAQADIEELRHQIRARWAGSQLATTFRKLNQENK